MSDVFRVLVVCTGNICRSAQAEQLIRARVAQGYPAIASVVAVESAGTGALVGSGMPTQAAALSEKYGGAPADHSARQLTIEQVRRAHLVLVMAAEHRSAVVRLLPRASRHTFTLMEFAALLESAAHNPPSPPGDFTDQATVDKLRSGVKWASARRGYLPPQEEATSADVIDPYRRSDEVYAESARQIVEALDRTERAGLELGQWVGS